MLFQTDLDLKVTLRNDIKLYKALQNIGYQGESIWISANTSERDLFIMFTRLSVFEFQRLHKQHWLTGLTQIQVRPKFLLC